MEVGPRDVARGVVTVIRRDTGEREELAALTAILEPRLFLGSAAKRLSPVPMPKRLLYGPRGSAARSAAAKPR